MTHRILLRTFMVDVPAETHDQTLDFWVTALGATPEVAQRRAEYTLLHNASPPNRIIFQRLESGEPRIHLDIHTDDLAAEVERLRRLGAREIENFGTWVIMEDPAGMPFCVVWALAEHRPEAERQDFLDRAKEAT